METCGMHREIYRLQAIICHQQDCYSQQKGLRSRYDQVHIRSCPESIVDVIHCCDAFGLTNGHGYSESHPQQKALICMLC